MRILIGLILLVVAATGCRSTHNSQFAASTFSHGYSSNSTFISQGRVFRGMYYEQTIRQKDLTNLYDWGESKMLDTNDYEYATTTARAFLSKQFPRIDEWEIQEFVSAQYLGSSNRFMRVTASAIPQGKYKSTENKIDVLMGAKGWVAPMTKSRKLPEMVEPPQFFKPGWNKNWPK